MSGQLLLADDATLSELRERAAGCRACGLWKTGTQTVFGEGPEKALVMMVGEQPGDREDIEGRPFVGPAGACSTTRSSESVSTAATST